MSGRPGGGRKVLLPPINFIFKLLQQHSTVQIWLYEQLGMRIEGKIRGFDEFMNLVIDEAVEVRQPTRAEPEPESAQDGGRRSLGEWVGSCACCGEDVLLVSFQWDAVQEYVLWQWMRVEIV